jgi:hypothetical protein
MFRSVSRFVFRISTSALIFAAASRSGSAQTAPTLTVDAAGNPHPINPDIYGIASYSLDAGFAKEIQVPNVRWGGDATTRYNWQVDSSNAGFDWYFMGGNGQTTPTPSASADLMINTYKTASSAHALMTIPIIPYVNKTGAWNCSFPVSVYGPQQSTNPYVHPNGDSCGNSITTSGAQLLDNNIYANHIDNTVALQQGWVQHLIATFGSAANGGVPYYQLDNEPGGWSNTHRDVEPNQPDYNTIISLGQQYAAIIKQTDPSAKVFGPVDFTLGGWIGTPSQQDNLYAGQYYLQQMAAYEQTNHQRILDYFDEHYYGGGSTDAAELASTRALWDPTFNSGSWVEQYDFDGPMMLLPRFRTWIQTYYPGTKLSISEYSFSSGTNPLVDALTEADVLGIYGREGLDFANLWTVPQPADAVAYSFRLYRNYDGVGGQFGDTSINSTSTDQGQLSVYGASRSSDGALTVIAINKTTSPVQTTLALANFNSATTAKTYTYSNANLTQIVAGSAVPVVSNTVNYSFAAYSATVFVFSTGTSSSPTATTSSLTASSANITLGQSVTFTATVTPASGTVTPTGTVTVYDGTTQIGTGTLSSSGSATFSTSALTAGAHSLTAVYSGDSNFTSSTSPAVSVTVSNATKIATTMLLSASATQLTSGQSVTLTASVAPQSGSGTPTGSVTFLDGQTQLGASPLSAGSSSFTSASLSTGTHSITATYSGEANYSASTSSPVTVTVTAAPSPDYSLSISSASLTVARGGSGKLTIRVTPVNGFKQILELACSGIPAGGNCTFAPQTLNPASGAVSTNLTVQAPSAVAAILVSKPFSGPRNAALCIFAMLMIAIIGAAGNKDWKGNLRLANSILASLLFAALLVTAGCAGLVSSSSPKPAEPAPYVVTVTASAANAPTHSQQFTLNVAP